MPAARAFRWPERFNPSRTTAFERFISLTKIINSLPLPRNEERPTLPSCIARLFLSGKLLFAQDSAKDRPRTRPKCMPRSK
jgi:hypothetical protein